MCNIITVMGLGMYQNLLTPTCWFGVRKWTLDWPSYWSLLEGGLNVDKYGFTFSFYILGSVVFTKLWSAKLKFKLLNEFMCVIYFSTNEYFPFSIYIDAIFWRVTSSTSRILHWGTRCVDVHCFAYQLGDGRIPPTAHSSSSIRIAALHTTDHRHRCWLA